MHGDSVLLVEDEIPERRFLEEQLVEDGFSVLAASGAGKVFELVEVGDPDLVVLEAALPDASGYEVCRRLRAGEPGRRWNQNVPVIMMSERNQPEDRVRAFARGADDYLARPFVYAEFVARMRALFRRAEGLPRVDRIVVGPLEIDRLSRVVRVDGERLRLAGKEFELLVALAEQPERVYEKHEERARARSTPTITP